MKIHVPSDYHEAFTKAIEIEGFVERGLLSSAFLAVGHSPQAHQAASKWGMGSTLHDREELLLRAERRLRMVSYSAPQANLDVIDGLKDQIALLPSTGVLDVDDNGANVLSSALESYSRLGLGQVQDVLDRFSFTHASHGLSEFDSNAINDIRHLAITSGGASFGITNNLLSDDVRNAWMARKFINLHMNYKRQPSGGPGNAFDTPMRLGACTDQSITIEDPDFSLPSAEIRGSTRWKSSSEPNF